MADQKLTIKVIQPARPKPWTQPKPTPKSLRDSSAMAFGKPLVW
jgi:hypothetical protein